MRFRCRVFGIVSLLIFWAASTCTAATPEQVDKAIASGVKFIYSHQKPDGTWEGILEPEQVQNTAQDGGLTAMCVYTLITAGDSPKDPRLARAIEFLMKRELVGTYALAFQALALEKLEQTPQSRALMLKICKRLIAGGERPDTFGLYSYHYDSRQGGWDHSCSQYGALGLWACSEAGIELPSKIWLEIQKAWNDTQMEDCWNYNGDKINHRTEGTVSMTSAGIATLFICDDQLQWKNAADCKGNANDPAIEAAIKWIIPHLKDKTTLYAWYGIERIGMASGYKYLGDFDWYRQGSDYLVKNQNPDGTWGDNAHGPQDPDVNYGVLFLVRGKAPVVMNKLRYDADPTAANPVDGNWNQRPRDAAGVAKFIGDELETFMNWQVVTLSVNPDDLHDSPILYIAGQDALKFSSEQEAKLKQFIEDGGLVLGNADCAAPAFAESFRALFERMFEKRYKFRPIPPNHPMYTREQFPYAKMRLKPNVEGLSNGVRELAMLIASSDPAKSWQMHQLKSNREAFELISDIFLYAVDRQDLAEKGVTYIIRPDPAIAAQSTVKLARIQYKGNWDPEPGGWRRLSAILHNQKKIDLQIETVSLGEGKLSGYQVADLTGTDAIQFTPAEQDELKKFALGGGTLIVDAAGGSRAFGNSMQGQLAAIFGAEAQQLNNSVAADDPIFKSMGTSDYHFRSIFRVDSSPRGPQLRSIKINKRPAVIFSKEDVAAGMVGENIDGIMGYDPETATAIMQSILVSLAPTATPATQPITTNP